MGCGNSSGRSQAGPTILGTPSTSPSFSAFKIVVIGDKSCGKTCLTMRFAKDVFDEVVRGTIGAAFTAKDLTVEGGSVVRLQIWDTAGQEAYKAMTRSFFRDSAAAVLVYDICDPLSFANARTWFEDFREQCPDSYVVLVGNKVDKAEARRVPYSDAKAIADKLGIVYFESSAKTGARVSEVFQHTAEMLVTQKRNRTGVFSL